MKKIWTGLLIIGLSLACLIVCAGSIAKEYGLVAILPIGMSQVSSCNWEESVKPGLVVKAGDPMGYFLFGGSDIVMIFQEGVSVGLLSEDHILMGEPYAEID
jgi:hypothetical protein